MEYSINKLSRLAGISTRTLRFYDEIGLLKPKRISSSGYRIYGEEEVALLQHILFYRELGLELNLIKTIVTDPKFDKRKALLDHREKLLQKQSQIQELLDNVDKTLAYYEGRITMSDTERFQGLKKQLLDENERKYGKEVREKYGNDTVEKSNQKFLKMSEADFKRAECLAKEIQQTLREAFKTGDPGCALAQKTAELHKEWLLIYWDEYHPEAHANLAQMYVDDERFASYYNQGETGLAEFLRDAIFIYTGKKRT